MTSQTLHDELEQMAGTSPAAYVATQAFARLTLGRLITTARLLRGREMPSGSGQLSASLRDLVWTGTPSLLLEAPIYPVDRDRELDIAITSGFDVIVDVFVTGDRPKVVSELHLSLSDIRVHLRAVDNMLVLEGSAFNASRTITRSRDAEAILAAAGIDLVDAARVEGHLSFGVVSQAVASALAKRTELPLSSLFPAFDFGSSIRLVILSGGTAIGIIPASRATTVSSARCTCKEGPDFELSQTTITTTTPPNPGPNDELGRVVFGGPIADNKNPLRDFGHRRESLRPGLAGVYIPRAFANAMIVRAMPAIKVVASDNGTLGYRAEATVGFEQLRVSFDTAGGGLLLDMNLDISVSAYCDMELFKGLRVPIGWALIQPANGSSPANLQLGFYPSVDSSGSVRLRATLKRAEMGSYVAVVIGIGSALKLLGVTSWLGFLVDVVLAAILSKSLPVALKRALGEQIAHSEWKLIDGVPVLDPASRLRPTAPFHAKTDSLLTSFALDG